MNLCRVIAMRAAAIKTMMSKCKLIIESYRLPRWEIYGITFYDNLIYYSLVLLACGQLL